MIYVLSGGQTGATLTVTSSGAGTITVSNATLGKSYSKSVTAGGSVVFKGLATGTWTVKLTDGSKTSTRTITITSDYSTSIAYFSATISITYPATSTCVVKNSSGTTVASNTNTGSSTKTWTATVGATGTYTVTATATDGSGKSKSQNVSITADGQSESVTLTYELLLYDSGNQFNNTTGGWVESGQGTVTFESTHIVVEVSRGPCTVFTSNKIELTDIETLIFDVNCTTTYPTGYPRVGVSSSASADPSEPNQYIASKTLSSGRIQVSIDVSSINGAYYVGGGGYGGGAGGTTITIYKVWGIPK